MPKNIVLSTDIGTDIDDALALQIAMNHPDIVLKGIYTTNGDVETRARIAKAMTDLAGYKTTVATGEAYPLEGYPEPYSIGHEKRNVFPAYRYSSIEELSITKDGVSDLIGKMKAENPIVASIAPLTNVAKAIELAPELNRKDTVVYLMGGRLENNEHNIRHDVEAARRVIDSDMRVVVVPADVCERFRRSLAEFDSAESECGKYVNDMLQNWTAFHFYQGLMLSAICVDIARLRAVERFPEFFMHLLDALSSPDYFVRYPKEYVSTFGAFMRVLEENRDNPCYRELYGKVSENLPKAVAVSDAYVIYAISHPDRVRTKKANIRLDKKGKMKVEKGRKHTLVTDVDYEHFEGFLKQYLK